MAQDIYYIAPVDFLRTRPGRIFHDPDFTGEWFWSDSWDPAFYVCLAVQGLIAIAKGFEGQGNVLLPQLQESYALLDWEQLHLGRSTRAAARKLAREACRLELVVRDEPGQVMRGLEAAHGQHCWLLPEYQAMVHSLAGQDWWVLMPPQELGPEGILALPGDGSAPSMPAQFATEPGTTSPCCPFRLRAVELRDADGTLVAGELGYTIGASYTSLSGFHSPEPRWNHCGKIQLHCLAGLLRARGFGFWNLGHPYMDYKLNLGARILPRREFLMRWNQVVAAAQPAWPRLESGRFAWVEAMGASLGQSTGN